MSSTDTEESTTGWAIERPSYKEAAYRNMQTGIDTRVGIFISKWRIMLNVSSKFKFMNDVSEISDPHNYKSVSFRIDLSYDTESSDKLTATINKVTIHTENLPTIFVRGYLGYHSSGIHFRGVDSRLANSHTQLF